MRQKNNFIFWYFTGGLRRFFEGFDRVIRTTFRVFSVGLLAATLLSPWHKDVQVKSWLGFDPVRSAQQLIGNLFSRVIGGIVRLIIIALALCAVGVVFALGVVFFVTYFLAPFVLTLGVYFVTIRLAIVGGFLIVVALFVVGITYRLYRTREHPSFHTMGIMDLAQQKWFSRVWQRLSIDPGEVTSKVLEDFTAFKELLRSRDITPQECDNVIRWEIERRDIYEEKATIFSQKHLDMLRPIGLYWHFGYTPRLNRASQDLTHADYSKYAQTPFVGHAEELEMVEFVLHRPSDNNALVVGSPGIGKHMIVHEIARKIRTGEYDDSMLKYVRVLQIDLGSVISTAADRGRDAEAAVREVFHEAAFAGNILLFIENFGQYLDDSHGFSLLHILEEYLDLPSFRVVALTDEKDFHTQIEKSHRLVGHFDVVQVSELSEEEVIRVLYMQFHTAGEPIFTYQAIREMARLGQKFDGTKPLPSCAVDLATETILAANRKGISEGITVQDVHDFMEQKTGVPMGKITAKEKKNLLSLEENFHDRIIGQNHAVQTVANAIRRMRSGMARPDRPAGSFLFFGPTGVGKTEMAKTIAGQYFGSRQKLVRLDMSEYQGVGALERFVGSRDRGTPGDLPSLVQENPYGILLLDELEKADKGILDLFLQILDEGVVHDAFGEKVSFTAMIIVATSNAGTPEILSHLDAGNKLEEHSGDIIDAIVARGTYRQEFINRFDDVVLFEPIRGDDRLAIAKLQLQEFARRVEKDQNIILAFGEGVPGYIVENGYEERFGARSILRYIDETLANALAKKLITGNVARGDDVMMRVDDLS